MKSTGTRAGLAVLLLMVAGAASAEGRFGIGIKAGTLGAGIEGTWRPLPFMDLRLGGNAYELADSASKAGIDYDSTLNLESFYGTVNLRVPLSPLRFTLGAFSNGNELTLQSQFSDFVTVGDTTYTAAEAGTLTSTTSFDGASPYVGVGLDFTLFGKIGLNLDAGLLWQGEPIVGLTANGTLAGDPGFQASLEQERLELVDEVATYKAWPVASLGFVVNF
jgi:hypothetical protein